ncbi:hypothetical protein CEK25_005524 [Fusarium fujikuroi]|nr:hypothetical protein CEK25_005524 [Fusarium fujikuroi]
MQTERKQEACRVYREVLAKPLCRRYITYKGLKEGKRLEKTKRPKGSLGRRSERGRSALAKAPAKIRQEDMKHAD